MTLKDMWKDGKFTISFVFDNGVMEAVITIAEEFMTYIVMSHIGIAIVEAGFDITHMSIDYVKMSKQMTVDEFAELYKEYQ